MSFISYHLPSVHVAKTVVTATSSLPSRKGELTPSACIPTFKRRMLGWGAQELNEPGGVFRASIPFTVVDKQVLKNSPTL